MTDQQSAMDGKGITEAEGRKESSDGKEWGDDW